MYDEEDEIQRKELKRLINSTKDPNRKAALERSLEELNNRNVIGNDTILTSDFSSNHLMRGDSGQGLTSVGSAKNLLIGSQMARPGSASIRTRRPSITLDKIPESANERRPDSNRRDGEFSPSSAQKKGYNGSFSDAKASSSRSSLDEEEEEVRGSAPRNSQMMRISSSDQRVLNVNIAEPNCDCTDIVSSSYYTPIVPAYVPFRDDASRAKSKGQAQQYSNTKGNLVRWVCTGLTPQLLVLQLTESFQIKSVDIECYGEVEEILLHMTDSSVSNHVTTLECRRNLTAGPSSSFSVDISSQIDASSHMLHSPSDICDKISFTIVKSAAVFFGIHKLTIHGSPMS